MAVCTEALAKKLNITREASDQFAKQSYLKSAQARDNGTLSKEIAPVTIKGKKGKADSVVAEDEEIARVNFDKIPLLNPVFVKDGTITAANASSLNDGAAACVLMSEEAVKKFGLKPLAKVVDYADAAIEPVDFGIAPVAAIEKVRPWFIVNMQANLTLFLPFSC